LNRNTTMKRVESPPANTPKKQKNQVDKRTLKKEWTGKRGAQELANVDYKKKTSTEDGYQF